MKLELEVKKETTLEPVQKTVKFTFSQDPDDDIRITANCGGQFYCVGFLRSRGADKVRLVLIGSLNSEYFELGEQGTIKTELV